MFDLHICDADFTTISLASFAPYCLCVCVCVAVRWLNIYHRKTGKAKIHENGNGAHNACTHFSICDLLQIMKGMILTFYLAKHIVNIFLKVVQFEQIYQQG